MGKKVLKKYYVGHDYEIGVAKGYDICWYFNLFNTQQWYEKNNRKNISWKSCVSAEGRKKNERIKKRNQNCKGCKKVLNKMIP